MCLVYSSVLPVNGTAIRQAFGAGIRLNGYLGALSKKSRHRVVINSSVLPMGMKTKHADVGVQLLLFYHR